jgi:hypothetical protein
MRIRGLPKLQCLQNKVPRTIGNLPSRIPTRDLNVASKTPYLFGFITKMCRQQAAVTLNHENVNIHKFASVRLNKGSIKCSRLVAVRHMTDRMSRQWSYPSAVFVH